jgi:hypothetical protein
VRELLGIDFSKVPNYNYRALRLLVCPVIESRKEIGSAKGLLNREGAHFMGWDKQVGNEGL